jgi:hypothetical protein
MVQKVPSKKALRHAEHIVFEYERWQPVIGWGSKSLLPTDAGNYSNEYGTKFARTFNEVAPPVPRGWSILTEFHCLVCPFCLFVSRLVSEVLQGNTWEYAVDLNRTDWKTEKGNDCKPPCLSPSLLSSREQSHLHHLTVVGFVRRRPWFREIIDADYRRVSHGFSLLTFLDLSPSPSSCPKVSKILSEPPLPPTPPPVVEPTPVPPPVAVASAALKSPSSLPAPSTTQEPQSPSSLDAPKSKSSSYLCLTDNQPEESKKQTNKASDPKPDWVENRSAPKQDAPSNPMHSKPETQNQGSKLEIASSAAPASASAPSKGGTKKAATNTDVEPVAATKGCCVVM